MSKLSDELQPTTNNASLTEPIIGNDIREGDVILLDDKYPCKITEKQTLKTGKHGHAKCILTGIDIFTDKKHVASGNSKETFQKVLVTKTEYQLANIDNDKYLQLSTQSGTKDNIRLPTNELGKKIEELFRNNEDIYIVVLSAMNQEIVCDYKKVK